MNVNLQNSQLFWGSGVFFWGLGTWGVFLWDESQVLKEHLVCWQLVSVMLFAVYQRASICWHISFVFHRSPTTWCTLAPWYGSISMLRTNGMVLFCLESWKKHLFPFRFKWPEEISTPLLLWRQLGKKETSTDILPGKIYSEAVAKLILLQLILELSKASKVASSIPFKNSYSN